MDLQQLTDPRDLLTAEEREQLDADLAALAKLRRDAEMRFRNWPMCAQPRGGE